MYFYRCTEQQLQDALEHIHSSGDTLVTAVFKGGRDWVLICERAEAYKAPTLVPRDPDYPERKQ